MSDFPQIPEAPPAPIRKEGRIIFSRQASVFVGWIPTFIDQLNAAGAWIQTQMDLALGYVQDALGYRNEASGYADDAGGHAQQSFNHEQNAEQWAEQAYSFAQVSETNANFKGEWDSLTGPLNVPAAVYWQGAYWQLLHDLPDVTASEPGQTGDWATSQTEIISWEPISGNATLAANRYYGVNASSGQQLTLPASPSNNDIITLYKRSGNFNGVVINRNGNNIMGLAENMNIDGDPVGLQFIFTGTGWRLTR